MTKTDNKFTDLRISEIKEIIDQAWEDVNSLEELHEWNSYYTNRLETNTQDNETKEYDKIRITRKIRTRKIRTS